MPPQYQSRDFAVAASERMGRRGDSRIVAGQVTLGEAMHRLLRLLFVALGLGAAAALHAETFPSRPLRLIVIVAPSASGRA
jgi:hypothetical protein